MAVEGKLQRDIADALEVSVMTYHRWRKARLLEARQDAADLQERRIEELQRENSRLRKLVTDLLLQKLTLEEAQEFAAARSRHGEPAFKSPAL